MTSRRFPFAAALAATLLALPALAAAPAPDAPAPEATPPEATPVDDADKPTLAIMYFDYSGNDEDLGVLRKGLAQMLISDLSRVDGVRIVERDRLQEILDELKLNQTTQIDKRTAGRVGKLLGAKYMVLGGYFDLMGSLRVDARLVEVETGRVIASFGATGKHDDFITLEQRVAEDLERHLASGDIEGYVPGKRGAVERPPVKRPKRLTTRTAARYGKALDARDRGDKEAEKKELEHVVAEAPDFTLATADLDRLLQ